MSRQKLRDGWMNKQRSAGGYLSVDGHWRVNRSGRGHDANRWAVYFDGAVVHHAPTMTKCMLWVEEHAEAGWRERNVLPTRARTRVQAQAPASGSDMDSAEFFCPCGRRYLVSLVPEASRIQDNGIRLRTKGHPLGRTVDLSIDG